MSLAGIPLKEGSGFVKLLILPVRREVRRLVFAIELNLSSASISFLKLDVLFNHLLN
jgi:hypothetical protein